MAGVEEGPGRDGTSHFHNVLAERLADDIVATRLRAYDCNVMAYEARLARVRGGFAFKYFQYLAVLFTEVYLDRLTADPEDFRRDLNAFLRDLQRKEAGFGEFPAFETGDLRKLAFFMATGSGKTLVMHVNLWQMHHYLAHGAHPEALVKRPDRARTFDAVILVTPNEGLSRQHIAEFQASGIETGLLVENRSPQRTFEPRVWVIEISKLAEEPSRDGVSIPMDELKDMNLVFVDEGHKGTSSEAKVWKDRQKRLAASGFTMEYSATFAQAIAVARQTDRPALLEEYGKAILHPRRPRPQNRRRS